MKERGDGERFLVAFNALKTAVDDDPLKLDEEWRDSERVKALCDELAQLVRRFEFVEQRSPLAFTHNVSPASALARRDYDDRWRTAVTNVAERDLVALIAELLGDFGDVDDTQELSSTPSCDSLAAEIAEWKELAREEESEIEQIMDYVFQLREMDDCGDREWIGASLTAWGRLESCGLDIAGTLWRRRALPHVLVPTHVARHYGQSHASLYSRLHQAGKAFVFGAPLAALALQRAVIEEVLTKHWGSEKGWVQDANLPNLQWDARANRLKRLANDALHGDPQRLSADELDRSIIENFLLLRLLIEHAPQDLSAHSGKMS